MRSTWIVAASISAGVAAAIDATNASRSENATTPSGSVIFFSLPAPLRYASGAPPSVHAGPSAPPSVIPGHTRPLGSSATTAVTSGNDAPSSSASSPPREAPTTASLPFSTPGCASTQPNAVSKYSSGISESVGGTPGAPK